MTPFPHAYRVRLPDFNQMAYAAQQAAALGLTGLLETTPQLRLLTYARPWPAGPLVQRYGEVSRARPEAWQRHLLAGEGALVGDLLHAYPMFTLDHVLLAPAGISRARLAGHGLDVLDGLPAPPVSGRYAEAGRRRGRQVHAFLQPVREAASGENRNGGNRSDGNRSGGRLDSTRPYAQVLTSHAFSDRWDQLLPLGALLTAINGPVVMAIDVRAVSHTQSRSLLQKLDGDRQNRWAAGNPDVQQMYAEMAALVAEGTLLQAAVSLLLIDHDAERLDARARRLMDRSRQWLAWQPLVGRQVAGLRLFQADAAARPLYPFPSTPERAALSLFGVTGFGHQPPIKGVFSALRQPLHSNQYAGLLYTARAKQQVVHRTVVARQGGGKTALEMMLNLREAARGSRLIWIEPQGHAAKFQPLLGDDCRLYGMRLSDLQINPLDVQFRTLSEQHGYFKTLLRLLLELVTGSRVQFDYAVSAVIDRAFNRLHAEYDLLGLVGRFDATPRFEVFVEMLRQLDDGSAAPLIALLAANFVEGAWAATFNRRSSLDLSFDRAVTAFNFRGVPAHEYPILYYLLVANINRVVFSPDAAPTRGRITIDEYRHMASAGLAQAAASLVKRARARGWSVTTIDQDIQSFVGDGQSHDPDGLNSLMILQNANEVWFGRTADSALPAIRHHFGNLREEHLTYMRHAGVGQFVRYTPDRIDTVLAVPTPVEATVLFDDDLIESWSDQTDPEEAADVATTTEG